MNVDRLVAMANDIGNFFGGEPQPQERIAGVRHHLERFWDPRMRRQIRSYVDGGGTGLLDHVRAAVLLLDPPRP